MNFDWLTKPLENPRGRTSLGNDPLVQGIKGWAGDQVEDIGASFGYHTPGSWRNPYTRAQEAAKSGDLDTLEKSLQEFGPGRTSEEIRTVAGLKQQAKNLSAERADQAFNKQADRLYGNNGLITGIETRRAAQQLASARILGEMQSKAGLASQSLANRGALDQSMLSAGAALGQASIGAQSALGQASINAQAGLKNTDLSGLWGFRTSAENNRSAESISDMTSGRNMVGQLESINAQREANLLANQTQRAGQVLNAYTQNYATTAGALASAANARSSFNPMNLYK